MKAEFAEEMVPAARPTGSQLRGLAPLGWLLEPMTLPANPVGLWLVPVTAYRLPIPCFFTLK